MIQQLLFAFISVFAIGFAFLRFKRIFENIQFGKSIGSISDIATRCKNTFLIAFGQKKMFKRWIPALFHLFIYVAFLFTQIELIEILIDGFTGAHRFFYNISEFTQPLYRLIISTIEVLSLLALVATFIFLARRNLLKIPRFTKSEMNGWPKLDGNIILYLELLLVGFVFLMNCSDELLHIQGKSHASGSGGFGFAISTTLAPTLLGGLDTATLHLLERIGWCGHILVVFAFMNYLPYSKHLHIFLAFPNVFLAKLTNNGTMNNMPEVQKEVESMFSDVEMEMSEEIPEFGANDVFGLTQRDILGAYSCTECGRCTSNCPANLTGKKLSPRKVMMDVRDRVEEVSKNIASGDDQFKIDASLPLDKDNYTDSKSLFDFITREEIHACTTCNACVEACPILINPLDIIVEMRRYEILTESAGPGDWLPMFNAVENTGAVWQMNVDRENWIKS